MCIFSVEIDTASAIPFFLQNICVLNTSASSGICCYLFLTILDSQCNSSALGMHSLLQDNSLYITGACAAVQILI